MYSMPKLTLLGHVSELTIIALDKNVREIGKYEERKIAVSAQRFGIKIDEKRTGVHVEFAAVDFGVKLKSSNKLH